MPLGRLCCYYVGKGLLELWCGAIRDRRIEWGRVRAQQPVHEVFSAQEKKKKEKREEQTFTVTTADVADDGGFMN